MSANDMERIAYSITNGEVQIRYGDHPAVPLPLSEIVKVDYSDRYTPMGTNQPMHIWNVRMEMLKGLIVFHMPNRNAARKLFQSIVERRVETSSPDPDIDWTVLGVM